VKSIVLTVTDSTGASATVTQAVTIKDTKKPTIKLKHVNAVHLAQKTVVRGTITDAGGIKSATISWGDHTRTAKIHLGRDGGFIIRHRYKKAKSYKITVKATDHSGHTATKHPRAKVNKPRHIKHKP
jgi:hypothetical protein